MKGGQYIEVYNIKVQGFYRSLTNSMLLQIYHLYRALKPKLANKEGLNDTSYNYIQSLLHHKSNLHYINIYQNLQKYQTYCNSKHIKSEL